MSKDDSATASKPLAYLQLARIPNVFTALADVTMGFLVVHQSLEPYPVFLLLAGASCCLYTAGMVLYVTQRPRLWPRVFSYHEVFHLFVVAGSAAHYAMTLWYVAPFAGT